MNEAALSAKTPQTVPSASQARHIYHRPCDHLKFIRVDMIIYSDPAYQYHETNIHILY
jgi:hypothetical protein